MIRSKPATKEYRDNFENVFGSEPGTCPHVLVFQDEDGKWFCRDCEQKLSGERAKEMNERWNRENRRYPWPMPR